MDDYDMEFCEEHFCHVTTCKDQHTPKNRIVTINDGDDTYALPFEYPNVKYSEALHLLLTEVDPGDEFTVHFKVVKGN